VELAAVVLGIERRILAERGRKLFQEKGIRLGKGEPHRCVVDLGDRARLACDNKRRGWRLEEFGVLGAVLDREDDVVGREGLAVRPLHAPAEMERELGRVLPDVPALGDVRQNLGELQVPAHETLVADEAQDAVMVGGAAQAAAKLAPVGPDLLNVDDERVYRQALGQCGQLALGGELGHSRRLLGSRLGKRRGSPSGNGGGARHSLQNAAPVQGCA
jgi:hypothetical protein